MQTLNQTSFSEIKTHFQKVVQRVRRRPVEIIYNGKPAAVLISRSEYKKMQAINAEIANQEDAEDIALYESRKDGEFIPFEKVFAKYKKIDGEI